MDKKSEINLKIVKTILSKIYNISILGSGRMATEYARLINSINNIKICNVYSRNLLNAKNLLKNLKFQNIQISKRIFSKKKLMA